MNVRITPRGWPHRTEVYGGIVRVLSDGATLVLVAERPQPFHTIAQLPLKAVAEIALDEDGGL